MTKQVDHIFVLPTLKATGGNLEAVRLARDIMRAGHRVVIISLWRNDHPIAFNDIDVVTLVGRSVHPWMAAVSLPLVILRLALLLRRRAGSATKVVLTHYSTYLAAFLTSRSQRWIFVQDLEWSFVPTGLARTTLRWFILFIYRRARLLSANPFLSRRLNECDLSVTETADIWADPFFGEGEKGLQDGSRDVDVTLILRKGAHKRADWGLQLLRRLCLIRPDLRILVISPDEEFARTPGPAFLIRPSRAEIRAAYRRSRMFVLFSEHEGFGLPPLEAMGSGCVPLCRDAGGIRAYMEPELTANIIPLDAPPEAMIRRLSELLDDRDEWSTLSTMSYAVFRNGLHRAAGRLVALERCGFVDATGVLA